MYQRLKNRVCGHKFFSEYFLVRGINIPTWLCWKISALSICYKCCLVFSLFKNSTFQTCWKTSLLCDMAWLLDFILSLFFVPKRRFLWLFIYRKVPNQTRPWARVVHNTSQPLNALSYNDLRTRKSFPFSWLMSIYSATYRK